MKPITNLVNEILAVADLEGLISMGSPKDEYLVEAEPIAAFIIHNHNHLNDLILADNIQYVFLRYFADLIDYDLCYLVAKEIMNQLIEQKLF